MRQGERGASRPRALFCARGLVHHANGRAVTVTIFRATSALTLSILVAPAMAQNSQQPVIVTPPVGDFDLPPSGQAPTPRPTASPAAPPPAIQPVPVPTPRASPRPAAQRPTAPQPTPAVDRTPAAATPSPVATPTLAPVAVPPVVSPSPGATGGFATDTAATPDDGAGTSVWLWIGLGTVLLTLGGVAGWLLGRRRQAGKDDDRPVGPIATPAPVEPPPPTPSPPARVQIPAPPAPAPIAPVPEGALVTELRPLRAAISDGQVTLDFELFIQNRGSESAENVRAVLALFGANAQQDEHIAAFHASARMAAGSEPFSIAPGGVFMLNGQVSLPDGQMPVVTVQGKPMFVPIVPVALRWYAGLSIKTLRDAFMVGTVPAAGSDRLGPLWVERAASGFGTLAAKRYQAKAPG